MGARFGLVNDQRAIRDLEGDGAGDSHIPALLREDDYPARLQDGEGSAGRRGAARRLIERVTRREPDVIIGGLDTPYLIRWHVIPRNRFCNVYLHHFMRSDDDRAEHTHPWISLSWLLDGPYREWRNGVPTMRWPGELVFRPSGKIAHRIELTHGPVWTLFITGPKYLEWYFKCPQGDVHWRDFTEPGNPGVPGKGCNQ